MPGGGRRYPEASCPLRPPARCSEPWDWAFYSEKVRAGRYAFDEDQLRPYFEANRVLVDGVSTQPRGSMGSLQGAHRPAALSSRHAHLRGVRCRRLGDGPAHRRLVCASVQARGGAWANAYVSQSGLLGTRPVIGNHLNIPKPRRRAHADDLRRGEHGVPRVWAQPAPDLSAVRYPRFSGTSVPRDLWSSPRR
ncbi:MAG: hypothetical protein IPL39_11575 [Opitutaceae bacterium]|nr:hypothetical protein [Opitutaceae bacterium]